MKKNNFIILLLFLFPFNTIFSQKERKLKKVMELKIQREGGKYGASVAWNPLTKKYYAAMAGDKTFFIGVYDSKGKLLSPPSLQTGCDIRGIWYNDSTKTIQFNGFKNFGWGEFELDTNGFPAGIKMLKTGMHQPNEQSAGAFDAVHNYVYFLMENTVLTYDYKTGELLEKPIELKPEEEKKNKEIITAEQGGEEEEEEGGDFNSTSLIFTGFKGREFGLLNYAEKRIVLFNAANGKKSAELSLPKGNKLYSLLNFAYCNSIYWLFDKDERVWKGYK